MAKKTGERGTGRIVKIEDVAETNADDVDTRPDPVGEVKPKYGMGYLPDEPDERDFSAKGLFGARKTLPDESLGLIGHVREIYDQLWTSSCVGNAIAGALSVRLSAMGYVVEALSRLAAYTYARAIARHTSDIELKDEGSYPRMAMKALRDWGIPLERYWPFKTERVNDELSWGAHQQASAFKVKKWWRIYSGGKDRIEDICQALASGYPVVFGVPVDSAFLDHKGSGSVGAPDPTKNVGRHMMYAVGYKTVNGERWIRIVNSWGVRWGDGGFFWARESFFAEATDCYVIQVG